MRPLKICFFVFIFTLMGAQIACAEEYLIVVKYAEMKLYLYKDGNEYMVFPIAIPRRIPSNLPIKGEVKKVIKDPEWAPTESTRKYYLAKKKIELPKLLKPGDPRNAMGKAKIIINFETKGANQVVRIHGTNDESSIGQRITRGCIRLHNKDVLALADIIKDKKTLVEFR